MTKHLTLLILEDGKTPMLECPKIQTGGFVQPLNTLSNNDLVMQLHSLVTTERAAVAQIIRYLSELDSRKYYLDLGYSSLFVFCVERLKYSKGSAYRRVTAARAIREHPEIVGKLEAGVLSLCSIAEIYKVSEEQQRKELLVVAEGKPREEVQKLVANFLPPTTPMKELVVCRKVETMGAPALPLFSSTVEPAKSLKEIRYSVTLEVDSGCMELLLKAQALTGTMSKSAALKKVLEHFVSRFSPEERIKRREKRRAQLPSQNSMVTGHIPAATRDKVAKRDGCSCTFVGAEGHRCTEAVFVELDHVKPFAMGGDHDPENLRVLCRNHNQLLARRVFGPRTGGEAPSESRNHSDAAPG